MVLALVLDFHASFDAPSTSGSLGRPSSSVTGIRPRPKKRGPAPIGSLIDYSRVGRSTTSGDERQCFVLTMVLPHFGRKSGQRNILLGYVSVSSLTMTLDQTGTAKVGNVHLR